MLTAHGTTADLTAPTPGADVIMPSAVATPSVTTRAAVAPAPPSPTAAYLLEAIAQAHHAAPSTAAYSVGAVLVDDRTGQVLATGFSRELPGNTHAEECCLIKIAEQARETTPDLRHCTLYTTMEPCSLRLSGKVPCAERLREVHIGRVVVGTREPPNFVARSEGVERLQAAGVVVDVDLRYEALCRAPNAHLLDGADGVGSGFAGGPGSQDVLSPSSIKNSSLA